MIILFWFKASVVVLILGIVVHCSLLELTQRVLFYYFQCWFITRNWGDISFGSIGRDSILDTGELPNHFQVVLIVDLLLDRCWHSLLINIDRVSQIVDLIWKSDILNHGWRHSYLTKLLYSMLEQISIVLHWLRIPHSSSYFILVHPSTFWFIFSYKNL